MSQSASKDDGTGGGDGELGDDMIEWMRRYDRLKGNGDVHRFIETYVEGCHVWSRVTARDGDRRIDD